MKAIYWNESDKGMTYEAKDIPEDMAAECDEWREAMVEATAEANGELMNKYLDSGELSTKSSSVCVIAQSTTKLFRCCGTAFKNKGVQTLLDAIVEYMPVLQMLRRLKVSMKTIQRVSVFHLMMHHLLLWLSKS